MENIINGLKQIKTRVDSGTITTVNGTETLLSKQVEYLLKEAINYSQCCKSDSEQFSFADMRNAYEFASSDESRYDGMTFAEWMSKR